MNKISSKGFDAPSPFPTVLTAPAIAPSGIELQQLTRQATIGCSFDSFIQNLTIRDIILECEGDGPLAQHPAFPGAVRQAIGSQLMQTASREALAGLPCPWSPACGFQVFFNGIKGSDSMEQQQYDYGLTPPWVLRGETADASSVRITLRLFGLGLLWSSDLADACHRAVEQGIFIGGTGPVCEGVLIRSTESVWSGFEDVPANAERAMVNFKTPFHCIETDDAPSLGEQFMQSLVDRTCELARWHGLTLADELTALRAVARDCRYDESGLTSLQWYRAVSQRRSASIAMQGQTGLMQILLPEEGRQQIIQLLRMGELLHTGPKLTFGQGRYELFLV
nr:CRISPR system precrRNA processing endoribonuclease RAMP protein Cas6 [uncultured Cohaesibacter sp.]